MRTLIAALVLTGPVLAWSAAAFAQTNLQEAKDGAEIVVGSAVACSEARHDPKILTSVRERLRDFLIRFEMPAGEADDLLDRSIETAKAKPPGSAEDQETDCEVAGVKPVQMPPAQP